VMTLEPLIVRMVRQAHHERVGKFFVLSVRPELVEGYERIKDENMFLSFG